MNKYTRKYFLNIYCMHVYLYIHCVCTLYLCKQTLFWMRLIVWQHYENPLAHRLLLENKARFLLNERLNLEIHRETEHKEWVSCIFTNSSETE